jgi:anti-sigma B factor antagonist
MARQGGDPMLLTIRSREIQDVVVLELSGKIVAGQEADGVRSQIRDLLATDHKKIFLNMHEVARVDSTGIGMLVESAIYTAKQGGHLKLVNVPRLVQSILLTHRLLQAFEIYENEEAAMASFAKKADDPAA